jgi:TetR/AcrR family transcriptional repressor of nem operon
MRYEKGHKESTRRRIVETAAARFRKEGIESVGVDDLMAAAGLTRGGFYSHFTSKEDLIQAAVEEASVVSRENFTKRIDQGGLEEWIRYYLWSGHRDHPERGCIAAALGSELARRPVATRAAFSQNFARVISSIESHLKTRQPASSRRRTAIGIFATMIGALQMARAVTDPKLSEEILEAGITAAMAQAGIKRLPSRNVIPWRTP